MQTTGKLVVLVRKLATGMQAGQHYLDPRHTLFRMKINRHTPTVIANFQRTVLVNLHIQTRRMTGNCFINTVINDFLSEVVGSHSIGIHAGTLAHRIQPA